MNKRRAVLFNAARVANRYNPVMRDFYQRLVNESRRPGKVALSAGTRKMLVTRNAIARDQQPWRHAPAHCELGGAGLAGSNVGLDGTQTSSIASHNSRQIFVP